jgi:hypothetical protein
MATYTICDQPVIKYYDPMMDTIKTLTYDQCLALVTRGTPGEDRVLVFIKIETHQYDVFVKCISCSIEALWIPKEELTKGHFEYDDLIALPSQL